MNKKLLVSVLLCFFIFSSGVFAQEVIERYRLASNIEDITYISTGDLAGKCAFADGWSVYTLDFDTGEYEKLFYYGNLNFGSMTRGISLHFLYELEVSIGLSQGKRICSGFTYILACFLNHYPCYGRDISPAASGTYYLLPGDVSLL